MFLHLTLAVVTAASLLFVPFNDAVFIATAMVSILLLSAFSLLFWHHCGLVLTSVFPNVLLDLLHVLLFRLQLERCRLVVQGVRCVRVQEKLGKEGVEDVNEVVHRGPCLVDHIQANTARPV